MSFFIDAGYISMVLMMYFSIEKFFIRIFSINFEFVLFVNKDTMNKRIATITTWTSFDFTVEGES